MRRARFAVWVLALGALLWPLVAFGQTVRLQDGTGTPRAVVTSDGALFVTSSSTAGAAAGQNVCTSVASINQATSTTVVTGVAGQRVYICAVFLLSATAQSVSVVEGTGTVCATGITGLIGGTTASVSLAANGGFAMTAASPWLRLQTVANDLCILQSGVGNVSGTLTYQSQ
jgi:hypothetical protein